MGRNLDLCQPEEVLAFWFVECQFDDWFGGSGDLDTDIRRRFRDTHLALAREIPDEWRATPENRLATIIVLDQFPRNIYRGTPLAFATDGLALREAKAALAVGADQAIVRERRPFFYMPFEHAEDLAEQERAIMLFKAMGVQVFIDYALKHQEVIAAYGRFPHRNAMLGRTSTDAEQRYLAEPGAGF